jgi:hypothetical protein
VEIKKYIFRKTNWWAAANYNIFDESKSLIFTSSSPIWQFRKQIKVKSKRDDSITEIIPTNSWQTKYKIIEQDYMLAQIKRNHAFSKVFLTVHPLESDAFEVLVSAWGNTFRFMKDEEEFGIISFDIWKPGEFGMAIHNDHYEESLIIAVAILVAELKQRNAGV